MPLKSDFLQIAVDDLIEMPFVVFTAVDPCPLRSGMRLGDI
ncbi:MAG: hypothetical protein ACLUB5_04025 [Bifidobacterium dentium]